MKHFIIGTAGHVDHGKTTLVRALTGFDTDRLPEEKRREISIDLGFAYFTLPSGVRAGVVDVPGHERFLKNMLAGITGVDMVILVVAADEGVMPQTREHLDILNLLEVSAGVVAITKADLVDAELLELVIQDVKDTMRDSPFEHFPIIPVSSVTGEGLNDLIAAIDTEARRVRERNSEGPLQFPIDRVFSVKGFGTVVTGTVMAGRARTGEEYVVEPGRIRVRIRGIQVHGGQEEYVQAGQRGALNLAGADRERLVRGQVVCTPGYVRSARLIGLDFQLLLSAVPLKDRAPARIHVGTAESTGLVILLDRQQIDPGSRATCLFLADTDIPVSRLQHFILRSYSPVHTIGGGRVLDAFMKPNAPRGSRRKARLFAHLESIKGTSPKERALSSLMSFAYAGTPVVPVDEAAVYAGMTCDTFAATVPEALVYDCAIHPDIYREIKQSVTSFLDCYFNENPLKKWCPKEVLRTGAFRQADPAAFSAVLSRMVNERAVVVESDRVGLPGREVVMDPEREDRTRRVLERIRASGVQAPELPHLIAEAGQDARAVVEYLCESGRAVRVGEFIYAAEVFAEIKGALIRFLEKHHKITVAEFRDLIGGSRKYALALLDYFDATRVTRRVGDVRILVKGGS